MLAFICTTCNVGVQDFFVVVCFHRGWSASSEEMHSTSKDTGSAEAEEEDVDALPFPIVLRRCEPLP